MTPLSISGLLKPEDLQFMGFDSGMGGWDQVPKLISTISSEEQEHIKNAVQRLNDVRWLSSALDADVVKKGGQLIQEGLLSNQFYLLLTCADTLGYIYIKEYHVRERFESFFSNLSSQVQQRLIDTFLTWKTNDSEMRQLGLVTPNSAGLEYPNLQQVRQYLQPLSLSERVKIAVDFLYTRRNADTHEAFYPQLGHHPNLSVLQRLRLRVPNVASIGDYDRLQSLRKNDGTLFFVYLMSDDPIAELRCIVLKGLEGIIRSSGPTT